MAAVDKKDTADLIVLAYQTRATCGMGKGEKKLFYKMCACLDETDVLATLELIPHYGYWKDMFLLQEVEELSAKVKSKALDRMASQLERDAAELGAAETEGRTPKLSLCAKFAPREGSHFDKGGLGLAKVLARRLFSSVNEPAAQRKYRKLVSGLNTALNTTEVLMAAGRFAEIEISRVASLCLQRKRKAFLNEALKGTCTLLDETGNRHPDDPNRVAARQHLRDTLAKKSANGKQLIPNEVAKKCMGASLSTLEGDLMDAQWASMREGVRQAMATAAAARDEAVREAAGEGAGLADLAALKQGRAAQVNRPRQARRAGRCERQHVRPAYGSSWLVSELSAPAFRDRVLTFESRPRWVDLSGCAKVADKVRQLKHAPWGGSTDLGLLRGGV